MDSLCLKILELNGLTLVEHEQSDGEADMDEQVSLFFANTSVRHFPEESSTQRITGLFASCLELPPLYWQDKTFFDWFCRNFAT